MPYGYLGQNTPNQTVSNSGVFSISDVADLEKQGKFGGSLELIEEQTVSSAVANIDFTSIKENKYDVHCLQYFNVISSALNDVAGLRFYESGVLETASVYQYAMQSNNTDPSFTEIKSTADSKIRFLGGYSYNFSFTGNGYIYFYNLGNSSKYSFCTFMNTTGTDGNDYNSMFGGGVLPQTSKVDGIRLFNYFNSGNFSSGTFKLYGVKQI